MFLVRSLFLLLALVCTADAQSSAKHELVNLTKLNFWVTALDADGKACGLTESALFNALKLPIKAYTKIREPKKVDFEAPFAAIHVTTLRVGSVCAHNVLLSVTGTAMVRLPHQGVARAATVKVWSGGGLISGSAAYVVGQVEQFAKNFANDWQTANP